MSDEVIEIVDVIASIEDDSDFDAELIDDVDLDSSAEEIYVYGVTSVNHSTGDVILTGTNGIEVNGTVFGLENWIVFDCGTSTSGV